MAKRSDLTGRAATGAASDAGALFGTVMALMLGLTVAFGALTAGALGWLHASTQLNVGDVWQIGPRSIAPPLPGLVLNATVVASQELPAGSQCRLGFGNDAVGGGTLVILGRTDVGDYLAGWASPRRNAKTGPDCGRSADLLLKADDVTSARTAQLLSPMVGAMGAM